MIEKYIKQIKTEALINNVPILKDESLNKIEEYLNKKRPNKILEIGTAVGYSAICFSEYLEGKDSKIITIEIDNLMFEKALENVHLTGLEDKINVIYGDAIEVLEKINEKFDVVFIDAAKGQYMKYLYHALRLTCKGSIIIADNILFKGMVMGGYNEHKHRTAVTRLREYIQEITSNEKLDSVILEIGDGIAISIVK